MNNLERIIRERVYIAKRKKNKRKQQVALRQPLARRGDGGNGNVDIKKIIGIICLLVAVLLLFIKCTGTSKKEAAETVKNEPVASSSIGEKQIVSAETEYFGYLQDFNIDDKKLEKLFNDASKYEQPFAKTLSIWTIERFKGTPEKAIYKIIRNSSLNDEVLNTKLYQQTFEIYKQFVYDIECFPIPKGYDYTFENTWKASRSYKGDRKHYGTDLMEANNRKGYTKIISMCDGVVENIGWNEMGGYRVGIRSEGGAYFYYAHLFEAPTHIKKGDPIRAGEYVGLMGDTGYGIEGTSGQFPVHLHIGIAVETEGDQEFWINPYYLLRYLEHRRIKVFAI